ncbi:MAG: hypothetical protein R3248_04560 [Candidatus Promineifilaceae bacterium]|nr:hypothetical protein [Candidatus Promineifilaceae bacterium]
MDQEEAAAVREDGAVEKEYWWKRGEAEKESCRMPPRSGQTCPECGEGTLAYDGLFILTCDRCGYVAESGASW